MKSHASLMMLLIPAGQWIMKMNQKYNRDFFFLVITVINNYELLAPTFHYVMISFLCFSHKRNGIILKAEGVGKALVTYLINSFLTLVTHLSFTSFIF